MEVPCLIYHNEEKKDLGDSGRKHPSISIPTKFGIEEEYVALEEWEDVDFVGDDIQLLFESKENGPLVTIFTFIQPVELVNTIRKVCKTFHSVCEYALSTSLFELDQKTLSLFLNMKTEVKEDFFIQLCHSVKKETVIELHQSFRNPNTILIPSEDLNGRTDLRAEDLKALLGKCRIFYYAVYHNYFNAIKFLIEEQKTVPLLAEVTQVKSVKIMKYLLFETDCFLATSKIPCEQQLVIDRYVFNFLLLQLDDDLLNFAKEIYSKSSSTDIVENEKNEEWIQVEVRGRVWNVVKPQYFCIGRKGDVKIVSGWKLQKITTRESNFNAVVGSFVKKNSISYYSMWKRCKENQGDVQFQSQIESIELTKRKKDDWWSNYRRDGFDFSSCYDGWGKGIIVEERNKLSKEYTKKLVDVFDFLLYVYEDVEKKYFREEKKFRISFRNCDFRQLCPEIQRKVVSCGRVEFKNEHSARDAYEKMLWENEHLENMDVFGNENERKFVSELRDEIVKISLDERPQLKNTEAMLNYHLLKENKNASYQIVKDVFVRQGRYAAGANGNLTLDKFSEKMIQELLENICDANYEVSVKNEHVYLCIARKENSKVLLLLKYMILRHWKLNLKREERKKKQIGDDEASILENLGGIDRYMEDFYGKMIIQSIQSRNNDFFRILMKVRGSLLYTADPVVILIRDGRSKMGLKNSIEIALYLYERGKKRFKEEKEKEEEKKKKMKKKSNRNDRHLDFDFEMILLAAFSMGEKYYDLCMDVLSCSDFVPKKVPKDSYSPSTLEHVLGYFAVCLPTMSKDEKKRSELINLMLKKYSKVLGSSISEMTHLLRLGCDTRNVEILSHLFKFSKWRDRFLLFLRFVQEREDSKRLRYILKNFPRFKEMQLPCFITDCNVVFKNILCHKTSDSFYLCKMCSWKKGTYYKTAQVYCKRCIEVKIVPKKEVREEWYWQETDASDPDIGKKSFYCVTCANRI